MSATAREGATSEDPAAEQRRHVARDTGVVPSRSAFLGRPLRDSSPALLARGYAWLPELLRRNGGRPVRTRLLGQRAVGVAGPEAVAFFYDEHHLRRHTAIPGPVQSTLFGRGSVHTLDGPAHRVRKAMFLSLMTVDGVTALTDAVGRRWDDAVPSWAARRSVVLFDESSRVIAGAVAAWAGVPVAEAEVPPLAADLVALVDGFGNSLRRQRRARVARRRREAWLTGVVREMRAGERSAPPGSALAVVSTHRDADGELLDDRTAAVELLNVLRPTVAVCWFVAYAAHALDRHPESRDRLSAGDAAFTEAFVHEVRRFYPFAPFVGARSVRDVTWQGTPVPADSLVLLDIYGQHHDPVLWGDPYAFRPERFLERPPGPDDLVPQGGGDPHTGHRCPGEGLTIALLTVLVPRLARLGWTLPPQDLGIPLRRLPTRPRSGVVLADLELPATPTGG